MIPKQIKSIQAADLRALVDAQVREGRAIEYKECKIGTSDGDRKEFLFDLASLGNAGGGDLIIGVIEERDQANNQTALPKEIVGVDLGGKPLTEELDRLEKLAQQGIAPRLPLHLHPVDRFPRGPAIVCRVQRTFNGPHMVTFQGTNKFYSRNSTGKFPMDVSEIRTAFLGTGAISERVRDFCRSRIELLTVERGPVKFGGPFLLLHVVPLAAVDGPGQVDPREAKRLQILPIDVPSNGHRFNLDGYLSGHPSGFVQVFRNGSIEAGRLFQCRPTDGSKTCYFASDEVVVLRAIKRYLNHLAELEVQPPAVVQLSAIGLVDCHLDNNQNSPLNRLTFRFDRPRIVLPSALIEDFDEPVKDLLHPIFDAFWQAAGYESDEHFDDNAKKAGIE